MNLADVIRVLSVAALGLLAGAMVTEGRVLVPYWRALPPRDFLAWYAANDRRLLRFYGLLTAVATLAAVAAAAVAFAAGHPGRAWALVAAICTVTALLLFPLCFQEINARFAAGRIDTQEIPGALARWAWWHRVRTVLGLGALVASLLALSPLP